jgi:hypothetical protein
MFGWVFYSERINENHRSQGPEISRLLLPEDMSKGASTEQSGLRENKSFTRFLLLKVD